MTTQFLSRVEREVKRDNYSDVGPGSYVPRGTLQKSLPGFAPFCSTTSNTVYQLFGELLLIDNIRFAERMTNKEADDSPAPGSYDIGEYLLKVIVAKMLNTIHAYCLSHSDRELGLHLSRTLNDSMKLPPTINQDQVIMTST